MLIWLLAIYLFLKLLNFLKVDNMVAKMFNVTSVSASILKVTNLVTNMLAHILKLAYVVVS